MLKLLDFFFIAFHTLLVFFNLFGWIHRKTRLLNLITLSLTGSSWFLLGIFYGMGYCPLTDWHFKVLTKLGEKDLPASYIEYMAERFLPWDVSSKTVDLLTVVLYFSALIMAVTLVCRDYIRARKMVEDNCTSR
jgi:hypothetical protein